MGGAARVIAARMVKPCVWSSSTLEPTLDARALLPSGISVSGIKSWGEGWPPWHTGRGDTHYPAHRMRVAALSAIDPVATPTELWATCDCCQNRATPNNQPLPSAGLRPCHNRRGLCWQMLASYSCLFQVASEELQCPWPRCIGRLFIVSPDRPRDLR